MYAIENISGNSLYAEDIFEIEQECFGENSWSLDTIRRELSANENIYMICKHGTEIIGFTATSSVLNEAELNRIALKKQFRGRGLATRMIDFLIRFLKQNSFEILMLEVRSTNVPAKKLYEKNGFETDCIRKGYYQNPVEDAILMSLKL